MNPHPHTSLGKFVLYILVAIIFFAGGYFLGKTNVVADQQAAFYRSVTKMPCDYSPTNPCPDGTVKVNQNCPPGTQFVNGKCIYPETYTKASVEVAQKKTMTSTEWEAWCKSRGLVLNADGSCSRPIMNTASSTSKN